MTWIYWIAWLNMLPIMNFLTWQVHGVKWRLHGRTWMNMNECQLSYLMMQWVVMLWRHFKFFLKSWQWRNTISYVCPQLMTRIVMTSNTTMSWSHESRCCFTTFVCVDSCHVYRHVHHRWLTEAVARWTPKLLAWSAAFFHDRPPGGHRWEETHLSLKRAPLRHAARPSTHRPRARPRSRPRSTGATGFELHAEPTSRHWATESAVVGTIGGETSLQDEELGCIVESRHMRL